MREDTFRIMVIALLTGILAILIGIRLGMG